MSGGSGPSASDLEHRFPLSEELKREIVVEFPHFQIVEKTESRGQKLLGGLLKVLTLGAQSRYVSHYHTVMGYTLYVPECWFRSSDRARYILLRHERVHLRQRDRYGFVLFAALYLFPFLPMGLAYGRARLEWEAYVETLRATSELSGLAEARSAPLREEIIRRFTGGDYGWMWPFPRQVRKWFDDAIAQLETEETERSPVFNAPGASSRRGEFH